MERLGAERLVAGLTLAGIVGLAWLYLWREAAFMHSSMATGGMPMGGMAMATTAPDAFGVGLLLAMWAVMMIGMMLPSAAPAILLYGTLARKHAERGSALPAVGIFVAGYLLAWTGFSAAAALLQGALQHFMLLDATMATSSKALSALLLAAAGLYQLTPLKDRCLSKCREPLAFFMTHWRPGTAGALRMGIRHGAYCVGCCAVLMLLLFAVGVMNLAWIAALAAFVLVEKLLPGGRLAGRFAGAALLVLALVSLLR
jgi:predicted metal-binding membrane protein